MMIQLKNFSVDNLYNNLNLNVKKNEVTCIIGQNGSGKSILTKFILGIFKNYTGDILIEDFNSQLTLLTDENYQDLRKNIKLVVHNPSAQFIGFTVKDEITYKLEQNGIDNQTIKKILDNSFSKFNLDAPLHTLNMSEAQELLILSSLTLNEKVIIIDEALSNTSHEFKKYIFNLLKELEVTVLLITNNLADTYYADTVYKLKDLSLHIDKPIDTLPKIKHTVIKKHTSIECVDINLGKVKIKNLFFQEGLNVITGESGSGKSRLLNGIIGLNNDIKKVRSNHRFIGFVSQNYIEQVTKLTVYDQISNKEISESQIETIFQKFQLETELLKRDPSTLSTGQLAQILIIQNVLRGSDCIILDEVLEVIDYNKRTIILDYLLDNVECIILTTYNRSIYNDYPYKYIDLGDYYE